MIKLNIYTPQGKIFDKDNVKSITMPTKSGVITVLEEHQPLISLLDIGEVEIEFDNGEKEFLFISSGLIKVLKDSKVSIMADTSEFSTEIDIEAAQKAREKAEEYLKNNQDIDDVEFARIQGNIERELARIEIGKLRNKSKTSVGVKVVKK